MGGLFVGVVSLWVHCVWRLRDWGVEIYCGGDWYCCGCDRNGESVLGVQKGSK